MTRQLLTAATVAIIALLPSAAATSLAAESPLKVTRFTAKAKVTVKAGPDIEEKVYDVTYWVRDDMLRTDLVDPSTEGILSTIQREGTMYYWREGTTQGTKIPADSEQGKASTNFADLARCLRKAKNLGAEAIDGLATTKYQYSGCAGNRGTVTAWIAAEGGWIRQLSIEQEGGGVRVLFSDVEEKNIEEDRFFPPARVPFIAPVWTLPEEPVAGGNNP